MINLYRQITSLRTRRDSLLYLIFYTILWSFLTSVILYVFRSNNRTFLWSIDGLYQHYPAFNHLCSYVEAFFNNEPVSWFNLNLGQGADTLTTLNCYDFTDPVSIIAAAIVPLSRIYRYEFMIILKLYLIGISFYIFCRVIGKQNGLHIAAGALAYTFSGNILNMLTRHPNFINWAYFLPLMLAGAERYRRRKKPGLFIASVFFNILTNYYTFYINTVLLAVYVIVYALYMAISVHRKEQTIAELKYCLLLMFYGLVGVLLSMFTILPTLYAYLSNTRVLQKTGYMDSLFHYEPSYYIEFFRNICSFSEVKYLAVTGMNAVTFSSLFVFFIFLHNRNEDPEYRKKKTLYSILFVIMTAFLCIPLAGQILNGFGYATNRWSYALFFFSGMVLVEILSLASTIDKGSCVLSFIAIAVYIFAVLTFFYSDKNSLTRMGLITLGIVGSLFLIMIAFCGKYRDVFVLLLTLAGCTFQILFLYGTSFRGFVLEHTARDELQYYMNDQSFDPIPDDDTTFYRTEKTQAIPSQNQEMLSGRKGTSLYWSIIPRWVFDYHFTFQLPDMINPCNIGGLDARTSLMELACVKYFFKPDNISATVPFGYRKSGDLYENEYALPIAYFYDRFISSEDFLKMNPPDKQQALLEGILADNVPEYVQKLDIRSETIKIPYEIESNGGIELTSDIIKTTDPNGKIKLRADFPADCEIYLWIDGVELLGNKGSCSISVTRLFKDETIMQSSAPIHNLIFSWPIIRDGITYNLGYGGSGVNDVIISFSDTAVIKYDSINIIAVPMADYSDKINKLKDPGIKDIKIGSDSMSLYADIDRPGIIQLSVPYSVGWKAYDNGVGKEIIRSDIMYMAIPIEEGEHKLELKYHIPYFREGLYISLASAIMLILISVLKRRRRRL